MNLSPIHRKMLPIVFPTILMNISLPLLGVVDTAVMGHLEEVYYVGAVGIGSMIFSVLYWAFGFLRMGMIGLAAQSYGRGDKNECAAVLWRGLASALCLGLLLIAARDVITSVAFTLIDATPEVERHAMQYVQIRILAAPAALLGMAFTGWFYGVQRIALPVILQVGINGLNVVLDLIFVLKLGFDSDGVAWATVIAQYVGLAFMLLLFGWRFPEYRRLYRQPGIFDRRKLLVLLTINTDLFIRTASLLAANSYFLARSATHGNRVLAANTILIQFRNMTAYALDGIAAAAEVLVGSALGSGRKDDFRQAIRLSIIYGMTVGGGISLIYLVFHPWLLPIFTRNPEVLALAGVYVVWIIVDPLISNWCFILDGIFIGATATKTMRNAMLIAVLAIYFPVFLWLEPRYGNHGMWAATVILYAVRGVGLGWPLRRMLRSELATLK